MIPTDIQQLRSSTPGDGISIASGEDGVEIHLRACVTGKAFRRSILVAGCATPLGVIPLMTAMMLWLNFEDPDYLFIAIFGGVGFLFFIPGAIAGVQIFFAGAFRGVVKLGNEKLEIIDRGRDVTVPWQDVLSLRVLYLKKTGQQLHAKLDWPWLRGKGNGFAIETPHGTFKVFDIWHHEVNQWVAKVIGEYGDVPIVDRGPGSSEAIEETQNPAMPSRVARKDLTTIGLCMIGISMAFVIMSWPIVKDGFDVKNWQVVEGQVTAIAPNKRNDLIVTYEYEVNGTTYTNDRYRISEGHSIPVEQRKKQLIVAQPIDVWFAPDDPQRSTIEKNFPYFEFICLVVTGCGVVGGLITIIYAKFARDGELAKHYAVTPPARRQPETTSKQQAGNE